LTPAAFIRATLRSIPRKVLAARSTACAFPRRERRAKPLEVVGDGDLAQQRVVEPLRRRGERAVFADCHVGNRHDLVLPHQRHELVVGLPIPWKMREGIDPGPREPLCIVEVEDMRDDLQVLSVRLVDHRARKCRTELRNRAIAIVDPDLDYVDAARGLLADRLARFLLRGDAVSRGFHRGVRRAGVGRRDAATCHPEQRPTQDALSLRRLDFYGQRTHFRSERQNRRDAGIGVSVQLINDVVARVILGGERSAALEAQVNVAVDERRHDGLAGQVDACRSGRGSDGTGLSHSGHTALLDEQDTALDRRTSITRNQAGAFEHRSRRLGGGDDPRRTNEHCASARAIHGCEC
jgi:hypothetical protein